MTSNQEVEIKAFLKREEYLYVLSTRGFNNEKLTDDEIDVLRNAKINIESLLEIYDLDKDIHKRLERILLNIINTEPIKYEDTEQKSYENSTKNKYTENSLSVAIKKELHNPPKEIDDEEYFLAKENILSPQEIESLSKNENDILSSPKCVDGMIEIYKKLGGFNRLFVIILTYIVIMPINMVMGKFIVKDVIMPLYSTLSLLLKCTLNLSLSLALINIALDIFYMVTPAYRNKLILKNYDTGTIQSLVSAEARLTPVIENKISTTKTENKQKG